MLCSRIHETREKHLDLGEDPDSFDVVMEDVSAVFSQTLEMVREELARLGIDPDTVSEGAEKDPCPSPDTFPLYQRVLAWHEKTAVLVREVSESSPRWIRTEKGLDLSWYMNTFVIKTARLVAAQWGRENGDMDCTADLEYTKYVLAESMQFLKRALKDLYLRQPEYGERCLRLLVELQKIEHEL